MIAASAITLRAVRVGMRKAVLPIVVLGAIALLAAAFLVWPWLSGR